jgi:uncharacterized delta-60 repeat protein
MDLVKSIPVTEKQERDSFSIGIRNNTNSVVYANLLGNVFNLSDNANAKRSFTYNITGETFSTNSITIQYRSNSQTSFTSVTLPLSEPNMNGLVATLNNFGIGTWFYSGNNLITYNDDYVFGTLNAAPIVAGSIVAYNNFGSGFDGSANSLVIQSDGKPLIGGAFITYDGNTQNRIARLLSDGNLDTSFVIGTGFNNGASNIDLQSSGKIIVGNIFTSYNGIPANRIIRLNTDGTYDNTFVFGTGFTGGGVFSLGIQNDDKIFCIGGFTNYNGTPANRIVRLNANGTIDATFIYGTGFNLSVDDVEIQSDGKILFGGQFTSYNGTPANRIIRLNSNGSVDPTFVYGTGFNALVTESLSIQSDGKILVGGDFTSYNGTPANRVIRLNPNGSVDNTFNSGTGFDGIVQRLAIQSNGKILVGGFFTSYNGTPANRIIRLNSNGSVDTSFVYGTGFDNNVVDIEMNDIFCYIVGNFTSYNGTPANRIISLYL